MKSQFVPGLCFGVLIGLLITVCMYQYGPIKTRDKIIEDNHKMLRDMSGQAESCTKAYIKSHNGMIPKGTRILGKGLPPASIIVIDYQPPK